MADVQPVPAGFPGCRACPYRRAPRTGVCLACLRRSCPEPSPAPGSPSRQSESVAPAPASGTAGRSGAGSPVACAACGQPIAGRSGCANRWCARADRGWSVAFAVGVHRGPLRRAVVDYKYRERRWWGPVLARLAADWLAAHHTWVEDFDVLVPVPAYLGPGGRRRWDPVGELATMVAAAAPGWDLAAGALVKDVETPAMTGRSATERLGVAEGPLRAALRVADPAAVAGARVLVFDDVLTDGATLREVARGLRAAGAIEVAGLALTRPGWSPTAQDATT